jgi:hypothetical protein
MIVPDKSFVNTKMEESLSSNTPEIVTTVSNSLFAAPPALQPPCCHAHTRSSTMGMLRPSTSGLPQSIVVAAHCWLTLNATTRNHVLRRSLTSTQSSNQDRR